MRLTKIFHKNETHKMFGDSSKITHKKRDSTKHPTKCCTKRSIKHPTKCSTKYSLKQSTKCTTNISTKVQQNVSQNIPQNVPLILSTKIFPQIMRLTNDPQK